jgi:DNA-binding transcriptional LysR family regulator
MLVKNNFSVRQVEAFKYFMITGSITNAAHLLYITQPAASRLLSDLEYRLGFKLFNRSHNKITPTPEAHLFYREVQRMFVGLDSLVKVADSIARNNAGRLRIGYMHVAGDFIIDVIAQFLKGHQDVKIELESGGRLLLEEMIKSGSLDMAMTTDLMVNDPALTVKKIGKHQAYVAMHVDNPLSQKEFLTVQDLADERFMVLGFGSPFRTKVELAFEQAQIERNITVEARTQACLYQLVKNGVGTAILDEFVQVRDPQVVMIPFMPQISWEYSIIVLKANQHPALVNTLHKLIVKNFNKYPGK